MPRRHNTILHDRVALAAAAGTLEKDLPINPISFLTLTLRALNNGASAVPTIASILGKVSNVEVLLDGKTLAGASLTDLAVLTFALWGIAPHVHPISKTDNDILNVTVQVPFGRSPWHPTEALPATRKGDLSLRLTYIADAGGIDTVTATVDVRQILDSDPQSFLKYVTSTKTPSATGEHEMDLVTGPDYLGILFFGTTVPTAAAQTASIAKLKLKVDDVEHLLPETRWESLHREMYTFFNTPLMGMDHTHISDLAAAYTQFQLTGRPTYDDNLWNNYAYLDFDPRDDNSYRLNTRGRSRVHFVVTADVADLIRMIPVELIPLVEAPAA
jgi:hypothetical protein